MKITLKGKIPSKKNSKQIFRNKTTGRSFITSSNNHKIWQKENLVNVKGLEKLEGKYCIICNFTVGDRRKFDLSNKFESIADLLVDAGIIEDDNYTILSKVILNYIGYEKDNFSTEIILEEIY